MLTTKRLVLRPWVEEDAAALYKYASDPLVGPAAGWPVHTSVENSRDVIREVLSAENTFAICLNEKEDEPIGSIGLMMGHAGSLCTATDEAELGYWIGVPFWGNGYAPEACRALIAYGFEVLGLDRVWCGYYDGNDKSRRVIEKCGFAYHHTSENVSCPLMGDVRTEHVYCIDRLTLDTTSHGLSSEAREKANTAWDVVDTALFLVEGLWI